MNKTLLAVLLALATAVGLPAHATPISATISLDTVYAGNTPDGSAPWLTATFTSDTGSTTGTLTLTSNLSASDFVQGLNSAHSNVGWAFFLNQSLDSIGCTSGTCADNGALFGGSYNAASVPGTYNLAFGWSSGHRFEAGDSAVYTLTFDSALTGNPFAANEDGWWSVAHVQGISPFGCSGWIVSGDGSGAHGDGACVTPPPHPVPEPAELGLFGFGLLLIGTFLGIRRRWQ